MLESTAVREQLIFSQQFELCPVWQWNAASSYCSLDYVVASYWNGSSGHQRVAETALETLFVT